MRTQIKNNKTKKIITAALYTMIIAGAAGAATGTYAWYSYQKNVSVDFKGASISNVGDEIEVGLRAPDGLDLSGTFETTFASDIALDQITKEDIDDEVIYWVKGNFIQNVLMEFVKDTGYSDGTFTPITSGSWKNEDAHTSWGGFKKTPALSGDHDAEKTDYMKIPLAFRVKTTDADATPSYQNGKAIYLSKFDVNDITDNTDYNLREAVRCKVDFPTADNASGNYIFNPTADAANELAVGGVLNLNKDIYYDYKYDVSTGKYEEIAYGEFQGDTHKEATESADPTVELDDCTTFKANHLKGVKLVDETHAKKCETRKSAVSTDNAFVTTEAVDGHNAAAFVDLSIYLEGWDKQVVDQTQHNDFSISLEFMVK
ncbi:MAG: hypothetical protein MJZ37_04195 [Bacilli bacterium]|nr:hypothetical protein [Bacilli bacterium]